MSNKPHLSKIKAFVNNSNQWDAFLETLEYEISCCHKKLEQSKDIQDIYQTQGAISALRRLKYLKDEVNVQQ